MKKKIILAFIWFLVVSSLSSAQTTVFNSVTVFYSTTCPICQKTTLTLKELKSKYEPQGISFQLIFPSRYDTKQKIKKFEKLYQIPFPFSMDHQKQITGQLNATVTPQAILTDSIGNILYSGKIDNWFENIGQRRTIITEHYLDDAISSYLKGEEIKIKKTEPVGCIIN